MEQFAEIINNRVKNNQAKYSQRQALVEHPFGTLKRSMNFYHLLLRGFSKVRGEISIAFFSYNLKRVINILGVKGILQSLKLLFSNLICYIYKITTVRFSYNRSIYVQPARDASETRSVEVANISISHATVSLTL